MSAIEAQNVLMRRLQAMPGRPPLSYVGGPNVVQLPRIVIQIPSPAQATATLSGQTQGEAFVVARIETQMGEFSTEADQIAQNIEDWFPVGLLIDGVKIEQSPRCGGKYSENGVLHFPVTIRGRYEF